MIFLAVIIVSPNRVPLAWAKGLAAQYGAVAMLDKPFDLNDRLARVNAALDRD